MKYKNLFIDLDDTLWDTSNNNKECLKEIYADYPFHQHYPSFETFFDDYMPNNLQLWAQYRKGEINKETLIIGRFLKVLEPLGITDKEYILSLNKDFLKRTTLKTKVLPGTFELLEYLRPSFRMFILSNGFREVQALKLRNAGLEPYFSKMILSEDACSQKPNKKIFDYALINTNSKRTETLMIGDCWEADIVGAKNANIDQIWLNLYDEKVPQNEEPPTYMVHSLKEIESIL